jgi:hypothetical protein
VYFASPGVGALVAVPPVEAPGVAPGVTAGVVAPGLALHAARSKTPRTAAMDLGTRLRERVFTSVSS